MGPYERHYSGTFIAFYLVYLLAQFIFLYIVQRTLNSQGGAIWSISVNPSNSLLALGCEDGCVRLISLEGDSLQQHRRFDRVKCRVLSIAWGPPIPPSPKKPKAGTEKRENTQAEDSDDDSESDDEDDEWTDSWLVTGGSDSALRKWDVKTGRVLDRMSTDKVRGERTLVWSVGVLASVACSFLFVSEGLIIVIGS